MHSVYAAVATCVLVLFIVSPTILLILYPTRLFRKCVSCWGFRRWHALQMIVESFQGQYKDGTNGNHDFRMVSATFLILRIVILASFLNRHTYIWSSSGQCLLLAGVTCFYGITRPYKLNFMDSIDIVILFLLEVLSVVASNPSPNHFVYAILLSVLLLGVPHMVLIFCCKLTKKAGITQRLKRIYKVCVLATRCTSQTEVDVEADSDTGSLLDRLINPEEYEPLLPTRVEHTAPEPT